MFLLVPLNLSLNSKEASSEEPISKFFDISRINSSAVAAEEKGTSLGLLLCKEFVDKHGGKIWAENGNGNRNEIKFTLPVYTRH